MKYLLLLILLPGCVYAPKTKKETQSSDIIGCIHGMIADDVNHSQAFEICRQIFSLKKIEEKQQ